MANKMTLEQYKFVKSKIRKYQESLDIKDVILEFSKDGLLNQNYKLKKGEQENIAIYGLELLPETFGGRNLCPMAGECKFSCIAFSGKWNIMYNDNVLQTDFLTNIIKKRARRTFFFNKKPKLFKELLKHEIQKLSNVNLELGIITYFRLNVFSDINWNELMKELVDCNFYGYTKVKSRKPLVNSHITFSDSEKSSTEEIKQKLKNNINVAVVFEERLPSEYLGYKVINGDLNDFRWKDPVPSVVGLLAKRTIGDKSSSDFFK